jgi:hypothetical protein
VGHILWSTTASAVMRRLAPPVRSAIERRTAYLQHTPRMYAVAYDERFPGCRSFWADDLCHVFYMVAAGGNDCYIVAVEEREWDEESGSAGSASLEHEL